MWKFTELDAYNSISLHDCRANKIELDGNDLLFYFPDGFWITPVSNHIDHDSPLKTGPSIVRFHALGDFIALTSVDIYKPTRLFGRTIFCRRLQPTVENFLKMINAAKYELEFITEYHDRLTALYQCWIWKGNRGMEAECQLEMSFKSVEYCWNEILPDREW